MQHFLSEVGRLLARRHYSVWASVLMQRPHRAVIRALPFDSGGQCIRLLTVQDCGADCVAWVQLVMSDAFAIPPNASCIFSGWRPAFGCGSGCSALSTHCRLRLMLTYRHYLSFSVTIDVVLFVGFARLYSNQPPPHVAATAFPQVMGIHCANMYTYPVVAGDRRPWYSELLLFKPAHLWVAVSMSPPVTAIGLCSAARSDTVSSPKCSADATTACGC